MQTPAALCLACALLWTTAARAQFGRSFDWVTSGSDAQRSSWVRTDPKISPDALRKPGFEFLWKLNLANDPRQLNSLTTPALLDRYIGYRGFRSLAFIGSSSDKVFAIDTDLARIEWHKQLSTTSPPQNASLDCPGGMTANVTRPATASFPAALAGGFGGGRGGPARSGVGEPDQGAITLARLPAPRVGSGAGGRTAASRPAAPPRRMPSFVHALSGDGMLHAMYVSNGQEPQPPIRFLPPNANARGLIIVDNIAYAATSHGCGGAADAIWALDLASKKVSTWKPDAGEVAGSAGPAFGPDRTLYVTTSRGSLAALDPKTLRLKNSYTAQNLAFATSPVIFEYKDKALIAAATSDGSIHLLDSENLGGRRPLYKTPRLPDSTTLVPGALASWQDSDRTRWILAPASGAILAWKLVDHDGAPALELGWTSRDMTSPITPMIINGVVFALSTGEFRAANLTAAQRAQRSSPAVLYALDGSTGKELWSSGTTITSFVYSAGLSGGGSQLYVGTHDSTLYAFGYPIEH